jgi:hypothetical protein
MNRLKVVELGVIGLVGCASAPGPLPTPVSPVSGGAQVEVDRFVKIPKNAVNIVLTVKITNTFGRSIVFEDGQVQLIRPDGTRVFEISAAAGTAPRNYVIEPGQSRILSLVFPRGRAQGGDVVYLDFARGLVVADTAPFSGRPAMIYINPEYDEEIHPSAPEDSARNNSQ